MVYVMGANGRHLGVTYKILLICYIPKVIMVKLILP